MWPTDASINTLLFTGPRNFGIFFLGNYKLPSKTLWHFVLSYQGLPVKKISFDSVTWSRPLSFTSAWIAPSSFCQLTLELQRPPPAASWRWLNARRYIFFELSKPPRKVFGQQERGGTALDGQKSATLPIFSFLVRW